MKTSAVTLGRFDVFAVMLFYAAYLGTWVAALVDYRNSVAFMAAIALAAIQAVWHGWLIRDRTREGCFTAFRLNHWLGFTVFAGIALSHF